MPISAEDFHKNYKPAGQFPGTRMTPSHKDATHKGLFGPRTTTYLAPADGTMPATG